MIIIIGKIKLYLKMKNKNKQAKGVKEPSKEDQRRSALESSQSMRTAKF